MRQEVVVGTDVVVVVSGRPEEHITGAIDPGDSSNISVLLALD